MIIIKTIRTLDTNSKAYCIMALLCSGIFLVATHFQLYNMQVTAGLLSLSFLISLFLHNRYKVSSEEDDDRFSKQPNRKQKELVFNKPYDKAFNLCLSSLKSIKRSRIYKSDYHKGLIIAGVGLSWHSDGEIITFTFSKLDEESIKVTIISKSCFFAASTDRGRNLDHLERIEESLKQAVSLARIDAVEA